MLKIKCFPAHISQLGEGTGFVLSSEQDKGQQSRKDKRKMAREENAWTIRRKNWWKMNSHING
jgi:hypothetical protein